MFLKVAVVVFVQSQLDSLHFYPFISQYVSLLTTFCLQILQNIL